MEHIIDVSYEQGKCSAIAPEKVVLSRLDSILEGLGVDHSVEFSVSFVDDASIQELNRNYRNKDESTDILTFVQKDAKDVSWPDSSQEEHAEVLGDMVISLETLQRNSEYFNVPPDEELYRLLVHGVLHLLGYDHKTNDVESEPMLQKQEALLVRLGGKGL